jgi:hypothetical protein
LQAEDIVKSGGEESVKKLATVHADVVELFRDIADKAIADGGGD